MTIEPIKNRKHNCDSCFSCSGFNLYLNVITHFTCVYEGSTLWLTIFLVNKSVTLVPQSNWSLEVGFCGAGQLEKVPEKTLKAGES